jgi:hypothetical protein
MGRALAADPAATDPLDAWFEPAVSARLLSTGLATLGDLLQLIAQRRQRCTRAAPRLGAKGVARITAWLSLHAAPLQQGISPLAPHPRRALPAGQPALTRPTVVADVPLVEALAVPRALGRQQPGACARRRRRVPLGHQSDPCLDMRARREQRTYGEGRAAAGTGGGGEGQGAFLADRQRS